MAIVFIRQLLEATIMEPLCKCGEIATEEVVVGQSKRMPTMSITEDMCSPCYENYIAKLTKSIDKILSNKD